MTEPVQPGDIVTLQHGGPDMTVSHVDGSNGYVCYWFVAGELKEGSFGQAALKKVQPRQRER